MKHIKLFEDFVNESVKVNESIKPVEIQPALVHAGIKKVTGKDIVDYEEQLDSFKYQLVGSSKWHSISRKELDKAIFGIKESVNERVDMEELQFTLKRYKKENPGKSVTYTFTKDSPKGYVIMVDGKLEESFSISEAKAFDADVAKMIKQIKSGMGWIDPEFVEETWENLSDTIDFSLVQKELYKRLIDAKLLAWPNPDNEEKAGVPVRRLQDVVKESINEGKQTEYEDIIDKYESKIWELDNANASWIPTDYNKKEKMRQAFQKKIDAAQKALSKLN